MAIAANPARPVNRGFSRLLQVRELRTLALLLIVVFVTAAIQPRYLSQNSLRSILLWIPLVAVIGMGQMVVIIIRGIDISVGSIVGLSGLVAGLLFRDVPGFPLWRLSSSACRSA